jgi:hypothetical protein
MRRKGIQRGGDCGRRSLPRDLLRLRKQGGGNSRQSGHVQSLTYRANAVWSAGVLVDEHAATGEIQQSNAAQNG